MSCIRCVPARTYISSPYVHALHIILTTPYTPARCGAAPTSSSPHIGEPFGVAARYGPLGFGESQMRALRAHEAGPSPRPRPPVRTLAPGSAPLQSSWPAAPRELDVDSIMHWSGVFFHLPRRRRHRRPHRPRRPRRRCRRHHHRDRRAKSCPKCASLSSRLEASTTMRTRPQACRAPSPKRQA